MLFQWDDANINHIVEDHDVMPEEAEDIFFSHPLLIGKRFEGDELRYKITGQTRDERVLSVVWTPRGEYTRVVTAFDASMDDERRYRQYLAKKRGGR